LTVSSDLHEIILLVCEIRVALFTGNYRLGPQRYLYREKLLRMHRRLSREQSSDGNGNDASNYNSNMSSTSNSAMLEVNVAHLGEYDAALLGFLRDQPATILPMLELAASDALNTLLYDLKQNKNTDGDDDNDDTNQPDNNNSGNDKNASSSANFEIQILLLGNLATTSLRSIKSEHLNRLLKCPGIVISAAPVKCRATTLVVRCSRCYDAQTLHATEGPFGSVVLPSRCHGAEPGKCGANPYGVVPDDSSFVDRQTIKLQEAPEQVPTGEMPRSVLMAVERTLVDRAPPGTRVSVFCIPTLFSTGPDGATRSVYLRVIGLAKDNDHGESARFTPQEEEAFIQLSRRKDVFEILTRSVAPTISGSYTVDIKRALVCLLLGGTGKRLPDGVRLRGDINVLLLGDPSTAKSQFLKFISKVAPIGIYTSGKGSSAAGLTASVVRDAKGEFYLEGGAMVLADGGVVCIVSARIAHSFLRVSLSCFALDFFCTLIHVFLTRS
jgi:DNA replication licensing factor MCM5